MTVRGVLVTLLCVLMLILGASTASALIVRLPHGNTVSYQPIPGSASGISPFDSVFHNLDYNGGSVMSSNTNYTFYWAPAGSPAYPSDYQPGLNQFFTDLAHDSGGNENVDSVSTQYNDVKGAFAGYDSHFAGAIVDTNPYPVGGCEEVAKPCIADYQIKAELASYLKAHKLPMDLTHEYFVLLPPGVESCFGNFNAYCSAGTVKHEREAFCAYHSADGVEGGVIVYADDPYVAGGRCDDGNHPNGTTADATISGGLSHEHNESLTDPEPNKAWTDWASGKTTGYENGDKCRTFSPESEFGTPLGEVEVEGKKYKYNQVINGHKYWYQQEWSNQGHACLQRLTFKGEKPTAAFTFTADEEEESFNASSSTAPGGVSYYDWQLGEFEGQTPQETSSPTFTWGNTKGVHLIALTVFAADGSSAGTAHWVNIGKIAFPTVAKVSPAKGPVAGGTTVTITGTNLIGGEETAVKFGSVNATSFTVSNSQTKITATAPTSAAGTVDVTVTTLYGTSEVSAKDHFKYGPPTVTNVSPNSGSKAGGMSVTITGAGFEPGTKGTSFKVGKGQATAVNCASTTECTFSTPAAKVVGTVDVIVTVNKVSSVKGAADHFAYN